MTPSQPRIGQINTKLICDFLIQNSYERQSDAPPHVRASPCAAAAWIDLKLCTAAICDFRHQIRAFARQEKDGKTVFGPLGNFYSPNATSLTEMPIRKNAPERIHL